MVISDDPVVPPCTPLKLLSEALKGAEISGISATVFSLIEKEVGFDISQNQTLTNLSEEQITSLKNFEVNNADFLLNLTRSITNIENASDARKMQIAALIQNRSSLSVNFVYIFGGALVALAMVYIFLITWLPIPESSIRFADTILGFFLGTLMSTIINFFFGSSMHKSDGLINTGFTEMKDATKKEKNE